MTTRREALLALPLACAAAPILAQTPARGGQKRLGVISLGPDSPVPPPQRPFYVGLRQKGWVLGDNLLREPAYADGKVERLPELAEGLVRSRVDVILAINDEATVAAARATQTIPIVFVDVFWPQELGLVESDARPGRNVTGLTVTPGPEVGRKRLEFMKAVAPGAKRVAWFLAGTLERETVSGGRFDMRPVLQANARDLGFQAELLTLERQDFERAFADMVAWRAEVFLGGPGLERYVPRQRVVELLMRYRMPSAFFERAFAEAGGLMAYSPSRTDETYRADRLVDYIDRVLRGTLPAALPVERPRGYDLVINMKTANALGLMIPQSLLVQAEEVIR